VGGLSELLLEYLPTLDSVGIKKIVNSEYEVECREGKVRLKPFRVYTSYVHGRDAYIVWALFICPDGSFVKKAVGKYFEKSLRK